MLKTKQKKREERKRKKTSKQANSKKTNKPAAAAEGPGDPLPPPNEPATNLPTPREFIPSLSL